MIADAPTQALYLSAQDWQRIVDEEPRWSACNGAVGVGDESDGYAEAWYLPAAFAVFQNPNQQRASTIWYHDHTLGITRLNVYAGPAGFYIIRGGPAGDSAVLDSRADKTYYEIPIAIQDRLFNADGSLFYPDMREFFDGIVLPVRTANVSPVPCERMVTFLDAPSHRSPP